MTGLFPRHPFRGAGFFKALFAFLIIFSQAIETAAPAAEVKFGGEFRARGFYDNNLTDAHTGSNDQEAFNDARFRLKISAAEGLATGVVLIDFFNGAAGRNAATLNRSSVGSGTGNRVLGSEGFGRSLDTVSLKEGYLRVSWPWAHLVIGRQGITLGRGLIFDDTADAVSVAIPIGWASLTIADLLLSADSSGAGSTSVYLADLNLAPTAGFGSSLFGLLLKDRGPNLSFTPCPTGSPSGCPILSFGDDHAALAALGWAMDYKGPSFRWGTEADYLKGSIRSHQPTVLNPSGRGMDLHGANLLGRFGWTGRRIDAEWTGLYSTGQKPDDLPPTGHKLNINAISPNFVLGNILVNNETVSDRDGGNIGGLTAAKLSIGFRPTGVIRGELAVIRARLTHEPTAGASRDLGWEFDANAAWQLDPNLLLSGGFGLLLTGDAWPARLGGPQATDNMIKLSTRLVYAF
ncbi:MAG: hypothetical protein HY204_03860 [Nitrospirae bacterium]|nr:hypothetical protein [Nitrospirota bacterium]